MGSKAHKSITLPIRVIQRIVDLALILAIAGFVILFGLQFPHSSRLDSMHWIIQLRRAGAIVIGKPASWLGYSWPTMSHGSFIIFFPLFFAFLTWVVKIMVDAISLESLRAIDRWLIGGVTATTRGAGLKAARRGGDVPAAVDTEEERAELLRRYHEIETALKAAKRKRCAFLSVDVAGSTAMKVGEDETAIAVTFHSYEQMLRTIFEEYGAWKQAWTPDGVMVCFLQSDLGAAAAKRILESMQGFNEKENKLRTPFQLRCGMNEGDLTIYEDSRLEKISDRVIDIAGHMQKLATAGALWISPAVYESLADKSGYVLASHEVDGFSVYEWKITAASPAETPEGARSGA